jgi:hypothetical protein
MSSGELAKRVQTGGKERIEFPNVFTDTELYLMILHGLKIKLRLIN